MVITDTGTQNEQDPTSITSNDMDHLLYDYEDKVECEAYLYEEERERLESKQGWFVPRNIRGKNLKYYNKVKRTIRNCLPRKIRTD